MLYKYNLRDDDDAHENRFLTAHVSVFHSVLVKSKAQPVTKQQQSSRRGSGSLQDVKPLPSDTEEEGLGRHRDLWKSDYMSHMQITYR